MNLMLVDDEVLTVEGLLVNIEWSNLGIHKVFTAYNIQMAKDLFTSEKIDILLCDIEMPMGNGIELLRWLRQMKYDTECIFLTCHEDFAYAKEAIRLGCAEYLLKPVEPESLLEVILKAEERLKEKEETLISIKRGKQWEKNKNRFKADLWQELLTNNNFTYQSLLLKKAEDNGVLIKDDEMCLLVLFSIKDRSENFYLTDEHLIDFALNNIVDDIFSEEEKTFVKIEKNRYVMIIITKDAAGNFSVQDEKVKQYIGVVKDLLKFHMIYHKGSFHEMLQAPCVFDKLMKEDQMFDETYKMERKIAEQKETDFSEISVVEQVKRYISENIGGELSREEIAGYVYLNPDYLNRIFKKEVGMSLKEYILQEKTAIAKELLEVTDMAVSEIGIQVGYYNFGYFSTSFKKITGMTPIDYRQHAKSENEKWQV